MAVSDGLLIRLHKKMGLVKEVFYEEQLNALPGKIAIGHVRYPTKGSATEFTTVSALNCAARNTLTCRFM